MTINMTACESDGEKPEDDLVELRTNISRTKTTIIELP